jgi:hypothetical protein
MSIMRKLGMRGQVNVLLIPMVVVVLILVGTLAFGMWAFQGRQNYKNNVDALTAAAVQSANQQLTDKLNAQFAEAMKSPLSTYNGPEAFGSMIIKYPRTWSSYVAEEDQNSTAINGYFYPGTVPDVTNATNSYALRVQVVTQTPSEVLQGYQSQVQQGLVSAKPYTFPNVPKVVGDYLTGQIQSQKEGAMVIMPLRNQTLLIWTEQRSFLNDFNNIILKNFTFSP